MLYFFLLNDIICRKDNYIINYCFLQKALHGYLAKIN